MQKIEPHAVCKKEEKNLGDGGDIGSPTGGGVYFLHKTLTALSHCTSSAHLSHISHGNLHTHDYPQKEMRRRCVKDASHGLGVVREDGDYDKTYRTYP